MANSKSDVSNLVVFHCPLTSLYVLYVLQDSNYWNVLAFGSYKTVIKQILEKAVDFEFEHYTYNGDADFDSIGWLKLCKYEIASPFSIKEIAIFGNEFYLSSQRILAPETEGQPSEFGQAYDLSDQSHREFAVAHAEYRPFNFKQVTHSDRIERQLRNLRHLLEDPDFQAES